MSLRVWLPLDGDLTQQGTSGITVVNNGATVNTNGKIGSCYTFNGSTGYIALSGSDLFKIFTGDTQQFSITMWVFHADTTRAILFGDYATSGGIGFNIELSTSHAVRFYWNGSPDTYPANAIVAASSWTHVALTYDGTKLQSYINGVEKGSWSGTLATKNKASGEFRLGRDNRSDSTAFNGRMNDFRIYDHCLSAAEVHEIAQGLVLHYKLDDGADTLSGNIVGYSRYSQTAAAGATWGAHKYYSTQVQLEDTAPVPWAKGTKFQLTYDTSLGSGGGGSCTLGRFATEPSTLYCYSLYIQAPDDMAYITPNWLYRYEYAAAFNETAGTRLVEGGVAAKARAISLGNHWYRIWGTFTTNASTHSTTLSFFTYPSKSITYYFACPQLELGEIMNSWTGNITARNIMKDSSGYNYNGNLIGTFISTASLGRYSTATKWNSSSPTDNTETGICYIQTPITLTTPLQMSITWWANPESGYGGGTGHAAFCTSNNTSRPTDYNTTAFHHRDSGFDIYPSDASGVKRLSFTYTANAWHHYAITYDGSTAKAYQNGVLKTSVAVGSNKTLATFSQLYIGYSQAGGVKRKTLGSYSDFRVYVTALSADDILQLYHTGVKIDNKQNLHTFELNEINSNIFAGKIWSNSYSSHTPLTSPFINYNLNGEPQFTTNGTSAGSEYIKITPGTYEYDYTISVNTGNQFYIGIERYDANKTSRSNAACVYTTAIKPTADIVKQRYKGTVNLTTDGTNTIDTITLRILNGWSGTTSGVTGLATIHSFSLKLQSSGIDPSLKRTGQFIAGEFKEETNTKFYKDHIVEANEFIEL